MAVIEEQFSKARAFFWPIHRVELKHYLPIFVVAFLLGVSYQIMRNLKYGLLVLAPDAGAEAIPFVQLWGLVPAALIMTFLIARCCRHLTQAQVFYTTVSGFLVYFLLFIFVLYPRHEQLEPTALVHFLQAHLPVQLSGFIAIIRHWVISLFYVAAELWKVSVLAVLFWGYINNNIGFSQARRFYGPLMLATSLAGIAGGVVAELFPHAQWIQSVCFGSCPWHKALNAMMLVVVVATVLAIVVFAYLQKALKKVQTQSVEKKEKVPFSLTEAFKTMMKSRYLLSLGFVVCAEYVAFGLAEILWKDQLKTCFPDPLDFTAYTGKVILWSSLLSVIVSAVLSGGLINAFGWRAIAMIVPIILLSTSAFFYFFVLFQESAMAASLAAVVGTTPLAMAVFFGATHNCLCRVGKMALADPTKELAFIPLDPKTRTEGKAIIDGIGMHTGRAGGALVQQILLFCFPSVMAGAPVSALLILVLVISWMRCVGFIGSHFNELSDRSLALEVPAA